MRKLENGLGMSDRSEHFWKKEKEEKENGENFRGYIR